MLLDRGYDTLDKVNEEGAASTETIRKMPSYHCIILAKNDLGRTESLSAGVGVHLEYFYRRPKIPKSELQKYGRG